MLNCWKKKKKVCNDKLKGRETYRSSKWHPQTHDRKPWPKWLNHILGTHSIQPKSSIVDQLNCKRCLKVKRMEVHASSAIVAEALAVLEGCLLARQCNFSQIVVEFDCKQVLSYLNGGLDSCSWEIYPILNRILQTGSLFQVCVWSWVPRLASEAVNYVARYNGVEMSESIWVVRPHLHWWEFWTKMTCYVLHLSWGCGGMGKAASLLYSPLSLVSVYVGQVSLTFFVFGGCCLG